MFDAAIAEGVATTVDMAPLGPVSAKVPTGMGNPDQIAEANAVTAVMRPDDLQNSIEYIEMRVPQ